MSEPVRLDILNNELKKRSITDAYHELTLIDDSGTCEIYSAIDNLLGRKVILRLLKEKHRKNQIERQTFIDCSRYQSLIPVMPNVAMTFFINESHAYVEMESWDGCNLEHWQNTAPTFGSRFKMIQSLLEAMSSLHIHNIYHGALTPRSIIIVPAERLILVGIGISKLWAVTKGESFEYASQYLPRWWFAVLSTNKIEQEQGILADMYSISVICRKLWLEGDVKAPLDMDNKVKEFLNDEFSSALNAQELLNIFKHKFAEQIIELEFINEEKVKHGRHINNERLLAVEYFDNSFKDLHRRFFIDNFIHIILIACCIIGGVIWLLLVAEFIDQYEIKSQLVISGCVLVPPFALTAVPWFFGYLWRKDLTSQIHYTMRMYFEPRIDRSGCTWNELKKIAEKFFTTGLVLLAFLSFKPKEQERSKRLKTLQNIRIQSIKLQLFKIRSRRFLVVSGIIFFMVNLFIFFIIEAEKGDGWAMLCGFLGNFLCIGMIVIVSKLVKIFVQIKRKSAFKNLSNIIYGGIAEGYISKKKALLEVKHYTNNDDILNELKNIKPSKL